MREMDELSRLAHAARDGESGALEAFIKIGYDKVHRLCAARADSASADDLTQETFVRATGALARYRGDAPALTWLLSIARHTCMDELRIRARRRRGDLISRSRITAAPDPAEEISVRDLIGRLDPERRAAFVLTQFLYLPYDQAARICGCPVGTIRSRVARARGDLITMLTAAQAGQHRRNRA